jgi:uncharacterized protein
LGTETEMAIGVSKTEVGALVLDEIVEGTSVYDLEVPPEALALEEERFQFRHPVSLAVTVVRSLEIYHVKGRIDCPIHGECSRCLAPINATVQATLQLLVHRREAADEELEAVEGQEMDILHPGEMLMDLKERLRDEVILEMPERLYCREDCKGICPACGQDLNRNACSCTADVVDTRWAALSSIRF